MSAVYTTLWPCDVNLFHEWCEENDIDFEGDAASLDAASLDAVATYPSCFCRSVSI